MNPIQSLILDVKYHEKDYPHCSCCGSETVTLRETLNNNRMYCEPTCQKIYHKLLPHMQTNGLQNTNYSKELQHLVNNMDNQWMVYAGKKAKKKTEGKSRGITKKRKIQVGDAMGKKLDKYQKMQPKFNLARKTYREIHNDYINNYSTKKETKLRKKVKEDMDLALANLLKEREDRLQLFIQVEHRHWLGNNIAKRDAVRKLRMKFENETDTNEKLLAEKISKKKAIEILPSLIRNTTPNMPSNNNTPDSNIFLPKQETSPHITHSPSDYIVINDETDNLSNNQPSQINSPSFTKETKTNDMDLTPSLAKDAAATTTDDDNDDGSMIINNSSSWNNRSSNKEESNGSMSAEGGSNLGGDSDSDSTNEEGSSYSGDYATVGLYTDGKYEFDIVAEGNIGDRIHKADFLHLHKPSYTLKPAHEVVNPWHGVITHFFGPMKNLNNDFYIKVFRDQGIIDKIINTR